jgi:putative transposase
MFWLFFRHHLFCRGEVYLLAGDETVVTKAGHKTWGLDRFFSSIFNRPVPGLSFFVFSLVAVKQGTSHPIRCEQIIKTEAEKQAAKANKEAKATKAKAAKAKAAKAKPAKAVASDKPKAGRRKGVKNKDKQEIVWNEELGRIERLGQGVLACINGLFPLTYLVLDGHFGNNGVCQVVRQQLGLHLICKLRHDSALFFLPAPRESRPDGSAPRGPAPIYGERVDVRALPDSLRIRSQRDEKEGILTEVYQSPMRSRNFASVLNVVMVVKTNLRDGRRAHVVLFSSDLELEGETLLSYYRLRFQIEFNFRDAKSYFGLEDWMNQKEAQVGNAAQLSLFAVGVSQRLLRDLRKSSPHAGVLDLKARFRGRYYAQETLKWLRVFPEPLLKEAILNHVATLGAIHAPKSAHLQL